MKLGVYNAILHDRSLPEAIEVVAGLGLTGLELNTGGFLPPVHVPNIDEILTSDAARDDFLAQFEGTGVGVAGLNCNGNPLHPDPAIGRKHADDVRRSIRLAQRLGQTRVVTMSGLPGGECIPGQQRLIEGLDPDPGRDGVGEHRRTAPQVRPQRQAAQDDDEQCHCPIHNRIPNVFEMRQGEVIPSASGQTFRSAGDSGFMRAILADDWQSSLLASPLMKH